MLRDRRRAPPFEALRLSALCRARAQIFAGILLYSAYGLLAGGDDEEEDLSQNVIVKFAKANLASTDEYDGDRFFTTTSDQQKLATPLLLALVCVELSDVRSKPCDPQAFPTSAELRGRLRARVSRAWRAERRRRARVNACAATSRSRDLPSALDARRRCSSLSTPSLPSSE